MVHKLRKGSIVHYKPTEEACDGYEGVLLRILTKPGAGEVPDSIFEITGRRTSSAFKGQVLCEEVVAIYYGLNKISHYEVMPDYIRYHNAFRHNNRPCIVCNIDDLEPHIKSK